MYELFYAIKQSLDSENYCAAMFMIVAIPDICVALQEGKTTGEKYISWFENNLPQFNGYMSGKDCYAFRCALLHEGKDEILDHHSKKDYLDKFIILTSKSPKSAHRSVLGDLSYASGPQPNRIFINIHKFSEEVINAAQVFICKNNLNSSSIVKFYNEYNDGIFKAI